MTMKTMLLAAVAALGLGIGAAYAAGGPPGFEPQVYGSRAFSDHSHEAQVHFLGKNTVLGKMFHRDTNRLAARAVSDHVEEYPE
jgi:hypothetical protein